MTDVTRDRAHAYFAVLRDALRALPDTVGTHIQLTIRPDDLRRESPNELPEAADDFRRDAHAMGHWLNRVAGDHYFGVTIEGGECSLDADFTLDLPPVAGERERRRVARQRAAGMLARLKRFFAGDFEAAVRETPPTATYALETTARPGGGPTDEDRALAALRAQAILRGAHAAGVPFRMEQLPAGGRATHALVLDTRVDGRQPVPTDQLKALAKALSDAVDHGSPADRGFSVCFAPVRGSDAVARADLTTVVPGVTELRGVWSTGPLEEMREVARRLLAAGFDVRMADVPATAVVPRTAGG